MTEHGTAPGMHVGVMGAGQLGRMLALAGIPLGMRFTFFSETESESAASVGDVIIGRYDDAQALREFAERVDVVTYEFENVALEAAEIAGSVRPLWPPRVALEVTQDRRNEKRVFEKLGIPIAPYCIVESLADLQEAVQALGAPGVLKTCRFGYDGKGQTRIKSASDVTEAWKSLGGVPLIYERFVQFERELSVLAVRAQDGSRRCYDLAENFHADGILRRSIAPPESLSDDRRAQAERYAFALMEEFAYVGVFALELFDTANGLVANEMAPRVHNSGHWTIEGAETSQFENHVRAVCGLPLGDCRSVGKSAMFNVIGRHPDIEQVLSVPDVHVHLYNKSERAGRKLGHINIRSRTSEELRERIAALEETSCITRVR